MSVLAVCEWLETTALGAIARESLYGFQILVAVHILGLIWSVGMLLWVDLRMIGAGFASRPLSELYRRLSPWFLAGFAVMFISGGALFAGFATSAYANGYFRVKLVLLVLAGLNVLGYHLLTRRTAADWDAARRPPAPVRLAGWVSIVVWTGVILAGRMISYTMF